MRRRWVSRLAGVIGFAVAQLLAVQLVLGGVVTGRMSVAAALDQAPICSELGHGSTDDGAKDGPAAIHPAFCAICAFAATGALPAGTHAAQQPSFAVVVAPMPRAAAAAVLEARTEPRLSQGPPSIV